MEAPDGRKPFISGHFGQNERTLTLYQNQCPYLVIPAGFEPTACRLGDQEGVRLGLPSKRRKALVLLGF